MLLVRINILRQPDVCLPMSISLTERSIWRVTRYDFNSFLLPILTKLQQRLSVRWKALADCPGGDGSSSWREWPLFCLLASPQFSCQPLFLLPSSSRKKREHSPVGFPCVIAMTQSQLFTVHRIRQSNPVVSSAPLSEPSQKINAGSIALTHRDEWG